jgi:hypothetical protein
MPKFIVPFKYFVEVEVKETDNLITLQGGVSIETALKHKAIDLATEQFSKEMEDILKEESILDIINTMAPVELKDVKQID